MTENRSSVGRRLVLTFSLVSGAAVLLMTLAALIAFERGLQIVAGSEPNQVATNVAESSAAAFTASGGWQQADLTAAVELAQVDGYQVRITDMDGAVLVSSLPGQGLRRTGTTAEITVDGKPVGQVWVGQGSGGASTDRGRQTVWAWLWGAAAVALFLAVVAGWVTTRWLTTPLSHLTRAAENLAHGRSEIRADETAPGEIGALAASFNEAATAVERSAAARRQLAGDVAHELRTPLAALQAGLEELRDGLTPADGPTLTRLHAQTVRLGRVVEDLAVLSQVEPARAMVVEQVDLGQLVADELAVRGAQLRAAAMVVDPPELTHVVVLADRDRLHQVVGNLLANCARHCRPDDHVTVTVSADSHQAVLTVADTGPGIAAADLPHVFDRHWRADDHSPGSGLGLAVVAEIVKSLQGAVTIESPQRNGTVVRIQLPVAT